MAKGTTEFVQSAAMPKNTWGTLANFLGLFSANFFGERFGAALVITGIHLAAAALVAVAVVIALRRFFGGGDLQEGIVKFGKPYRVYRFQRYAILVWRKNLLPELTR